MDNPLNLGDFVSRLDAHNIAGVQPVDELAWRDHMRAVLPGGVAVQLKRDVALAQYRRLNALAPLLYIAIGSMALAGSYGSGGAFSWIYHLVMPAIFVVLGGWRIVVWQRRAGRFVPYAQMVKRLRNAVWFALIIAALGSGWTLDAIFSTVQTRQILAPAVLLAFISIAVAISLSPLPRAAIGVLAICLLPSAAVMIASPDTGVRSVGLSMVILAVLMAGVVCHHFAILVGAIRMRRELKILAQTDHLTQLANRRGLRASFDAECTPYKEAVQMALIAVDLNDFKAANDRFGHEAGDAVLVEVGRRLKKLFPDAPCVARLGGDEFAVLLATGDGALLAASEETIRAAIALPIYFRDQPITVSAATGSGHGTKLEEMMREADQLLYAKKPSRQIAKNRPENSAPIRIGQWPK